MGITERREREKGKMRRRIMQTAMALFIEDGYEKVSIRRIAEKIEYSPATIYLYFKDKDEILYRLHEEGFGKFLQAQKTALPIQDSLERLHRLGEIYLEFALANPEYYELMFIMKAPFRKIEDEWGCGYESFDLLRQSVAACIEQGYISTGNVDTVSLALWAQVHGLASLVIRERLPMIPEDQIDGLIRAVQNFNLSLIK